MEGGHLLEWNKKGLMGEGDMLGRLYGLTF
jgi:hypothetical protein